MNNDTKNTSNPQEKNNPAREANSGERNINPFDYANQNKGDESSLTKEATAEQQRKEA